jgi:hypothetical protein
MNNIFFRSSFKRYEPSLRLWTKYPVLFYGLKSVVTKHFEPTALTQKMYDILKVLGGEIKMKTIEGEGTKFIITILFI